MRQSRLHFLNLYLSPIKLKLWACTTAPSSSSTSISSGSVGACSWRIAMSPVSPTSLPTIVEDSVLWVFKLCVLVIDLQIIQFTLRYKGFNVHHILTISLHVRICIFQTPNRSFNFWWVEWDYLTDKYDNLTLFDFYLVKHFRLYDLWDYPNPYCLNWARNNYLETQVLFNSYLDIPATIDTKQVSPSCGRDYGWALHLKISGMLHAQPPSRPAEREIHRKKMIPVQPSTNKGENLNWIDNPIHQKSLNRYGLLIFIYLYSFK